MAADSASALWCSKRLFANSAPPLTDRGRESLPSHDCERIKQPQKRESRGDRVLHDPALGLLSSQVHDTFDAIHEETFMRHYEEFWDRKAGCDDLANLNLRWLSVLFIILAFGELLDCPQPCSVEAQRDCEDSSLQFYWSAGLRRQHMSLSVFPTLPTSKLGIVRARSQQTCNPGLLTTSQNSQTSRIGKA